MIDVKPIGVGERKGDFVWYGSSLRMMFFRAALDCWPLDVLE
jgi:hypothetical protein